MSAVMLKTGCEDNEMGLINIISDRKNVTLDSDVQITLKRNASSATAERLFHF